MLKLFQIASIAFFGSIFTANAASFDTALSLCKEKMQKNPPQVSVVVNFGALKYDFSKDEAAMKELFLKINPNADVYGDVQGLTDTSPTVSSNISVSRQVVLQKYVCSIPEKIEISVKYVNPTVYILRSLREGSCRYRWAVRHEQAHLDISHTALILLGNVIKNKLPEFVMETGPYVSSIHDDVNVADKLNALYQSYLTPVIDIFNKTLIQQHGRLDSEENYKKESQLCN